MDARTIFGNELNWDKAAVHDLICEPSETPNKKNVAIRIGRPAETGSGWEQVAYVVLTKQETREFIAALQREVGDPKPVVVVTRDPDASNEYAVFGGEVETYDIDAGYSDLRDPEEFASWKESHLDGADRLDEAGNHAAADHIRDVVAQYES